MEIKAGYKQTEVGVISEDWNIQPLSEISTMHGRIGWQGLKQSEFTMDTEDPFLITGMNFKDGNIRWEEVYHLSVKRYEEAKPIQLKNDDVLITKDGTIGKTLYVDAIPYPGKASLNSHLLVFRPLGDKYVPKYLYYQLNSRTFLNHVEQEKSGSTFFGITQEAMGKFQIPLPPTKTEQSAIANALSDADSLIASLEKLIAKKRNIKQGSMQLLLTGKKRLPGFSGEWETKIFEDIADKNVKWSITGGPFGSNLKASDYTTEGVRIIQLQNIGDGVFNNEYKIYTSKEKADELLSCNIYPGEIILSKMGDPVARACFIPNSDKRFLMSSDGIRLVVNQKIFHKKYVHDYINSIYFRQRAIEASTGTTRQRIGLDELKKLPFICPPLPEQTAIAQILSDMDEEIEESERKLAKYKLIKQGMMQELLTGKKRLI
jgi:type I restriction enzyme S subunit